VAGPRPRLIVMIGASQKFDMNDVASNLSVNSTKAVRPQSTCIRATFLPPPRCIPKQRWQNYGSGATAILTQRTTHLPLGHLVLRTISKGLRPCSKPVSLLCSSSTCFDAHQRSRLHMLTVLRDLWKPLANTPHPSRTGTDPPCPQGDRRPFLE
jgi:hypothetical protein